MPDDVFLFAVGDAEELFTPLDEAAAPLADLVADPAEPPRKVDI